MLSYLLSLNNKCYATSGNLNNHIGLPLTILHAPEDADFIVLEMGMNHAGEIRELCKIATPDAALINNIGPAHIGMLGSLENISKAKAEIFENLAENAIAVAPDGPEFKNVFVEAAGHRLTTFGMQPSADFHISSLKTEKSALFFSLAAEGQVADCRLNLAGRHNIFNAAAALALYFRLGFELHEGCSALQGFAAVNARMETISIDGISLILDCYNANPGSMSSALDYLASCPPPRIAVLGDMKELGDMSEQYHREMGLQAGKSELELLIAVGAEAKHIATAALENNNVKNSVIALNSNDEAAELLKKRLKTGATVLFKASRGMHFEHIVRKIWPELAEDLH
jgi:UDP-N-acetylmuramoyl-tripeptide--D-alanyl-D-alanine ligase